MTTECLADQLEARSLDYRCAGCSRTFRAFSDFRQTPCDLCGGRIELTQINYDGGFVTPELLRNGEPGVVESLLRDRMKVGVPQKVLGRARELLK